MIQISVLSDVIVGLNLKSEALTLKVVEMS